MWHRCFFLMLSSLCNTPVSLAAKQENKNHTSKPYFVQYLKNEKTIAIKHYYAKKYFD